MVRRRPWVALLVLLLGGCEQADPELASDDAEAIVLEFYRLVSSYDFEGMRAAATSDFEMIEAGARLDLEGFIDFLGGLQARGVDLSLSASAFRTEVAGDVAYTSNRMQSGSGSQFLEATILRRTDRGWLVDRVFSAPARDGS